MSDKRKVFKLGDIVDAFRTTVTKTAADELPPGVPVGMADDPQAAAQAQAQAEAEAQAAAQAQSGAQDPDGDGDNDATNGIVADAAKNVVNAEQQLDTAVDALKSIAKQAQDNEASALEKDASEFGKIFADSFLEEVNTRSEVASIQKQAYDITLQKIAEESGGTDEMYESITKEAYDITLKKVAEEDNISEEVLNDIIKEAYDLTMSNIDETKVLDELTEITKVAYQFTLDAVNEQKQ